VWQFLQIFRGRPSLSQTLKPVTFTTILNRFLLWDLGPNKSTGLLTKPELQHLQMYCWLGFRGWGKGFTGVLSAISCFEAIVSTPCEQSLFYRFFEEIEKEALHKSASSFEVAVAPNLGQVIPVYGCQTGFTSASINFYEKPMVETELTGYKENMAVKRWRKEVARKRLTCSHAVYQVFHLSDRYFRVLPHSHRSRKIFRCISLSTFADGRKRAANNLKALSFCLPIRPML